jgi:hypothetical protein
VGTGRTSEHAGEILLARIVRCDHSGGGGRDHQAYQVDHGHGRRWVAGERLAQTSPPDRIGPLRAGERDCGHDARTFGFSQL